jgi:CRP/FNR family transcriptional regulator, cyclic AMP receptor protein
MMIVAPSICADLDLQEAPALLTTEIATLTDTLAKRGWLSRTPPEFREAFLAHCQWRRIEAGRTIQHAGETGIGLSGVARGSITLTTALGAPDTPMTHIAHAGQWFGFVTLFPGSRMRQVSVVARSEVMLAHMTHAALDGLVGSHPDWWRHIGVLGIDYGNTAINIAADLMIRDSRRRCLAALLRLADCRFDGPPTPCSVEAPVSQEELAAIVNLSRSSIGTILQPLEKTGTITLGYRSIVVHDPAALRAVVDGG